MKHFNNIKKIRKTISGFTQEKLANCVDLTTRHIQRLEAGGSDLSVDMVKRLAQALNCTPADILGYENLGIAPPKETAFKEDKSIEISFYTQEFACGTGAEPLNYEESSKLYFTKDSLRKLTGSTQYIIAVIAGGDSMYPFIKDKDIVFIDTAKTEILSTRNPNKSIFAFRYDGRLHIKHLTANKKTNTITAHSFNKEEHPSFVIDLTKYPDFQIIGKVIGTYSKA